MLQEKFSQYIDRDRLAFLDRQQSLFDAAKPQLLDLYLNQYVAFEEGQVLDHDWDDRVMADRVYKKYGYRDIFMQWVTVDEPVYHVGGAFRNVSRS